MPKVKAEAASVPVTLFETVTDFVPVTVVVATVVVAALKVRAGVPVTAVVTKAVVAALKVSVLPAMAVT